MSVALAQHGIVPMAYSLECARYGACGTASASYWLLPGELHQQARGRCSITLYCPFIILLYCSVVLEIGYTTDNTCHSTMISEIMGAEIMKAQAARTLALL